jgi:formate-dependent nitrite reductase membrane component NrfD
MPSTLFTDSPHWNWLIVFYFFIGGIAGGAYFVGALIDLLGRPIDRPLARIGYYVALPAVIVCAVLLILDLSRPLRFWHMLIESQTWQPMFKWYSPMSFGSWAIFLFGAFSLAAVLSSLWEARRLRWSWTRHLRPPGVVGVLLAVVGGLLGLFVAGYTGILLAVTNRPIWSDSPLLGLVFLMSGVSTGIALVMLLGYGRRLSHAGVAALERLGSWVLAFELLALVAFVATVAAFVPRAWFTWWGALFLVGVFLLGILVPLALDLRPRTLGRLNVPMAAVLVLIGGFILRVVVLLSVQPLSVV